MCIKDIIALITLFLGVLTLVKGVIEYGKAQKYKKIELLESLISQFESEATENARLLLDDFWFNNSKGEVIKRQNLDIVLRNHKPDGISDEIEIEVRHSFDKLFDFFSKLDYLVRLNLISINDLYYFEYYLDKVFKNKACMDYAKLYGYRSIENMNIKLSAKIKF
jgi:hypothetical protein